MSAKRNQKGQFQPGQSGNPEGRPKNKTPSVMIRNHITQHMPEILGILIREARSGDIQAAKVLLDRACPPLRPTASPVAVPIGETLVDSGQAILQETLQGYIAPDIGSMLIKALSDQAALIKNEELEKRIEELERCLKSGSRN